MVSARSLTDNAAQIAHLDTMTVLFDFSTILDALPGLPLVAAMEEAFVAYSSGHAVVPPVGHLQFVDPPGDVCLKYGYLRDGEVYVVKIASGFYDNPKQGLPSSDGMLIVFDKETGRPLAVLMDRGRLTDARTGAAGAVVFRHLAPVQVNCIAVFGTGIQAREQVRWIAKETGCRSLWVWGRRDEALEAYALEMSAAGFDVQTHRDCEGLDQAQVIVTTTPSRQPLFAAEAVSPGTLVIALGADGEGKQELDPMLLSRASRLIADSREQCLAFGELAHARPALSSDEVVELGEVLSSAASVRCRTDEIVVADLTGVAVQDVAAASVMVRALEKRASIDEVK